MPALRILSIAAGTGRIGYVFFVGKTIKSWGISRKASSSPQLAAKKTRQWIETLGPDLVISEKLVKTSTKGKKTKTLIAAIAQMASHHELLDVSVRRDQQYDNKYLEANALAGEFPEIKPWLPKNPRIWETESRNMVYFEALAFAKTILDGPQPIVSRTR